MLALESLAARITLLSTGSLMAISPLTGHGQTVTPASVIIISPSPCSKQTINYPDGVSYSTGNIAECNVSAICTPKFIVPFPIYADAYSGLACPNHTMVNNANGGSNKIDTVNANTLAFDGYTGYTRGSSFAQNGCNSVPLYNFNSDQSTCTASLPVADGGGGGSSDPGLPPPPTCYYGSFSGGDPSQPWCNV